MEAFLVRQIKVEDALTVTIYATVSEQLLENDQLVSLITLGHGVTLAALCTVVQTVLLGVIPSFCLPLVYPQLHHAGQDA